MFLRGRYFVMGCTIDMNVDMFLRDFGKAKRQKLKNSMFVAPL